MPKIVVLPGGSPGELSVYLPERVDMWGEVHADSDELEFLGLISLVNTPGTNHPTFVSYHPNVYGHYFEAAELLLSPEVAVRIYDTLDAVGKLTLEDIKDRKGIEVEITEAEWLHIKSMISIVTDRRTLRE